MSVGSLTLAVAITVSFGSIVLISVQTIHTEFERHVEVQRIFDIALEYRDQLASARCTLPTSALTLSSVRATLTSAGEIPPNIENESSWRMTFDGGTNGQMSVTVFKVDDDAHIRQSDSIVLPVPGGDRTHEFFDAVFDSRVCP